MIIKVNGDPQTISQETLTIAELLKLNKVEAPEMVSVQLNGLFVNRDQYASTPLKENDEADFLYFLGGGAGFSTRSIHNTAKKKDPHGALRPPLYESVAFEYDRADDMRLAFEGKKPAHSYSRISNPTVEEYEERVRLLTGSTGALALSSGMAAISNLLLALAETGTNIVASRFLFGNTYSLLNETLRPWGLEARFVDVTDIEAVGRAIDGKTRAVFLETIANPQMQVPDLRQVAEAAHKRNVPLVADTTLTPMGLFRSRDFGVDVEVISATKFISGGATSVGGLLIDNGTFDWSKNPKLAGWARKAGPLALIAYLRREVYRNIGACLAPHNAWLHILGLETLALRLRAACGNALDLARRLQKHDKVLSVDYPGLENSPYHQTSAAQFEGRFGSLLCFHLADRAACYGFMDRLKVVRRATNLQDNKTLVLHPATTIFCDYAPEERKRMGVPDTLVRLSVGIEDVEDLWADLSQALGG